MPISLETKLAILQQCEYEWPRYEKWLAENAQSDVSVMPKQWTLKLRLLRFLATFFSLRLSLLLLDIPKRWIIWAYVLGATVKLRLLQMRGLQVIAIAGSYGKTSTKYIAHHVLSGYKNVVMTPENINTPIGIARLILSSLSPEHKIFIAELGEYYPGDIAGLTRFLSPDYKILTPVGFAHLERFGSKEKLERGLRELLRTNPGKGISYVYGEEYSEKNLSGFHVSRAGTEFSIDGQSYFIPLYGRHNAVNCLPALWLAHEMGMKENQIREWLATLPFVPHRLEPTLLENNILLLDNGYNANPGSSKESLAVLRELDGSQKIVCTPGFVELGVDQQKENERLGEQIGKVADLCIVINGVNTESIIKGLMKAGKDKKDIILASSEEEGMHKITGLLKPSAIILFENSVPELYKK